MRYIYIYYYSVTKKKEILPFVTTWVDPNDIILHDISQTKTYCITSLLCGMYKNRTKKLIDREQTGVCQGQGVWHGQNE